MSNQLPLKADDWLITDQPHGWFLQYRLPPTLLHYAGRALAFFLISHAMFDLFGLFSRLTQADYRFTVSDFLFLVNNVIWLWCYHGFLRGLNLQFALAKDGHVTTRVGVFPEACLASLRLSPSERHRGRSTLVFNSTSGATKVLVGEPGLPDQAARQLLNDLHARVNATSAEAATSHCETPEGIAC